ncbi:MAG: DUF3106 domain-containing protein [Rhizobacter sp.]
MSLPRLDSLRRRFACGAFALACLGLVGAIASVQAQTPTAPSKAPVPTVIDGVTWTALNPNQKNALRPLEAEWNRIEPQRRAKWIEIADKFPSMPPAEQARIQNRMSEWAKLTPKQRGEARMNYRDAQQVPAQERKAKWEAYNALPPEQRKQLAAKAVPPARKPSNDVPTESAATKSNVVPNSSYAPRPKAVAPTVAQAQPGATTNLITKRPVPPVHQPAGLPKIAVTPGFVDQSTLLPKRGPQGAATRSAAASASPPPPRP